MPKGNTKETVVPMPMPSSLVPLAEALVLMPLPLPWEIVTAAVSHVTMRAHESLGGGWVMKNARCGKQGSMVSSCS